jgi:hypothetical protein
MKRGRKREKIKEKGGAKERVVTTGRYMAGWKQRERRR